MSEPKPMPSYWSLYQEVTHLNGWTDKLRAENDKLRELVRFALHRCNADNPMCDACCDGYDGECELRQRMHELGVDE